MDWTNLIAFISASVMLTLLPGPDTLFVISQSITQGKKAGILIALGLCTGLIAHTTAASLGISIVLQKSPLVFTIIKILGGVYIFYLGLLEIIHRKKQIELDLSKSEGRKLYRRGIFMNLLNPKVSLFFLAFLPQFVNKSSPTPSRDMLSLGVIFIIQAIVIFTILSILADKFAEKLLPKIRSSQTFVWIKAIIYFTIALFLVVEIF